MGLSEQNGMGAILDTAWARDQVFSYENSRQSIMRKRISFLLIFALTLGNVSPMFGKTIILKNGMEYQGLTDSVATIGVNVLNPAAVGGNVNLQPVVVIDDGLRRTFVPKKQVVDARADVETLDRIRLKQGVVTQGNLTLIHI